MAAVVLFESASELATLTNTFKVDSVATDPTTISLAITTPAGVTTTYTHAAGEITKTSTGVYTKDIACSEDGEWGFVWTGTGAASDVVAGTWTVFATTLSRLYVTPQALKSRFGIAATDTLDDYEIIQACHSATEVLEEHCGRHFWRTAAGTVRTFVADDAYTLRLPAHSDIVSISALKTDDGGDGTYETTWASADYQLLPYNPKPGWPFESIEAIDSQTFPVATSRGARRNRVEITGVFGWPDVPRSIREAALILAQEMVKLKDAPFGVAGFGEFGAVRVKENPIVARLAGPYQRQQSRVPVG